MVSVTVFLTQTVVFTWYHANHGDKLDFGKSLSSAKCLLCMLLLCMLLCKAEAIHAFYCWVDIYNFFQCSSYFFFFPKKLFLLQCVHISEFSWKQAHLISLMYMTANFFCSSDPFSMTCFSDYVLFSNRSSKEASWEERCVRHSDQWRKHAWHGWIQTSWACWTWDGSSCHQSVLFQ